MVARGLAIVVCLASATTVFADSPQHQVVAKYCLTCHSDRLKTGGLTLESLDFNRVPADAATWEKVLLKLHARTMPPTGLPRPDEHDRRRDGAEVPPQQRALAWRWASLGTLRVVAPDPSAVVTLARVAQHAGAKRVE